MPDEPIPKVCHMQTCPRTDLLRNRAGQLRVFRTPVMVDSETGRVEVYSECYSCPAHRPIIVLEPANSEGE